MSFFLAIDAGGTKTDYLLADETHELARVRGGSIKRMRVDALTASANLDEALAQLSVASGISMQSVTRTCIGTAGETVPLVADWLRESLTARVSGELILLGDIEIALDAAFPGQPGIVVIAGTGSNVAGRSPTGVFANAGGWGPALADQGSGHKIGNEALRAVCLAIDQDHTTTLLPAIFNAWEISTVEEIVAMANRVPAPDFSRLTTVVLQCAEEGDALAADVMRLEGENLANLVCIIIRKLQRSASDPSWTPSVAFTGSIMEKVLPVRTALIAAIKREFPNAEALQGVIDPIAGALWRARNAH
jgi:glucosamine kinase